MSELLAKGTSLQRATELCSLSCLWISDGLTRQAKSHYFQPWPFTDETKQGIAQTDIYALRRIVPKDRGQM